MATIGETVTNGTAGSVLFVGAGPVLAQNNANLYWDNTNKRLGIGTTSPNDGLTVQKSSTVPVRIDCINTNTGTGANAQVTVRVAGANGGDAVTVYEVPSATSWIVGIDNSDSDKFKIFCNGQSGFITPMVMTTDGKIGVKELNPSAGLHLAAGTASLAPLKLTAGTNLTAPEDGAVEWDGSGLYITSGSDRRQLAYNEVANVLDFGAKGDGTTDDTAAFQAAADSLAASGGAILVPPGKLYLIGSKVTIKSNYPIWLVSKMGNRLLSLGTLGSSHAGSALIRPKNPLTYMFEWARPSGASGFFEVGGGGIDGIAFGDWIDGSPDTQRNQTIDGAVNIDEAPYFTIRDSYFAWLKGRALRMGRCVIGRVENSWVLQCGDTGKSAVDLDGSSLDANIDISITGVAKAPDPSTLIRVTAPSHGFSTNDVIFIAFVTGTTEANGRWKITVIDPDKFDLTQLNPPDGGPSNFQNDYISGGKASKDGIYAALWGESMGIEQCSHGAAWIKGTTNGNVWLKHCYFEDGADNDQSFVDQSAGGGLNADGCAFGGTQATAVIAGGVASVIRNSNFGTFYDDPTPSLILTASAVQSNLENLKLQGGGGQTGHAIDIQAAFCQLSSVYMNVTGRLNVAGLECSLSNIYMYNPVTAAGTNSYNIDLSLGSTLNGGFIDGFDSSPAHGIRAAGSTVTGVRIRRLGANANGIVSSASSDVITSNQVGELAGTGIPFVKAAGAQFWGNHADTGTSHLTRIYEIITLPQETWRNYTNNSVLTTTTTPTLTVDPSNIGNRITWPAGDNGANAIRISFQLPPGFDGAKDITIEFDVSTDNTGGGGVDPATIGVYSSFDGGSAIFDSATDSFPSTAVHTIAATIAAADITPDDAKRMALVIYSQSNANDPIRVHDVRVKVARAVASV